MKRIVVLWLCMILMLPCIIVNLESSSEGSILPENMPEYTAHGPIRINSNENFTTTNGVTGGTGTEIDPWIIEGWDISGLGFGYCIYIGNTTEHFAIQNCSVHDASGISMSYYYVESGIIIYHADNGRIQNCDVESNELDGICLYNSNNCSIVGNKVVGNEYGITIMDFSNHTTISDSSIYSNAYYGINLLQSRWSTVRANNVTNTGNGICISEGVENRVENNDISSNENGIDLWDSRKNTVVDNQVWNNVCGLYLDYSDSNDIANNIVSSNADYEVYLTASSGNTIYHNRMGNNTIAHTYDGSGGNTWDNGYPSGGNRWEDYTGSDANADGVGDTPYTSILGSTGAKDRYPLMNAWFLDTEPPIANAGLDISTDEDKIIKLNGTASTDNVGVVNYIWTFDKGHETIVLQGLSSSYNFTMPGIFSVTLSIADSAGNIATDIVMITVNDITSPVANSGPDQSVAEGALVLFDGSGSGDNMAIVNYTWTFNDGVGHFTLYEIFPSHIFSIPGVYSSRLNITDAAGLWSTDTMQVTVNPDAIPPIADAGPDQFVRKNDTVSFNGTGSSDNASISNYTWNFTYNGSALFMYGPQPSFRFSIPGNYTVWLAVQDPVGNTGADAMNVSVSEGGTGQAGEVPANETIDEVDDIIDEGSDDLEVDAGMSAEVWAIIIIIAVVLDILALFLLMRWKKAGIIHVFRRKTPPPSQPPPEP